MQAKSKIRPRRSALRGKFRACYIARRMTGLMRPFQLRRLTAGERAIGDEVFGGDLDPAPVRLFAVPAPRALRPFVPGEVLWSRRYWIVFPRTGALADFSQAPLGAQARFVHELTHVWQAQRGVDLLKAKWKAGYEYVLDPGCRWDGFNIEQQAMIVEDAFRLSRGGRARYPQACPVGDYERVKPFGRSAAQPGRG